MLQERAEDKPHPRTPLGEHWCAAGSITTTVVVYARRTGQTWSLPACSPDERAGPAYDSVDGLGPEPADGPAGGQEQAAPARPNRREPA